MAQYRVWRIAKIDCGPDVALLSPAADVSIYLPLKYFEVNWNANMILIYVNEEFLIIYVIYLLFFKCN